MDSSHIIEALIGRGLGPFSAVPCSILKPFINSVIKSEACAYTPATNEGEALAMAAGQWLGGGLPVVMLQNSGLGNMVNPLTSLNAIFRIPALLIITWRGEPSLRDAPQHALMGTVTHDLLSLLGVAHAEFPESEENVATALDAAVAHMATTRLPYGLVLRKGVVAASDPAPTPSPPAQAAGEILTSVDPAAAAHLRLDVIRALAAAVPGNVPVVSTTGKTSREFYNCGDRDLNFYMVGSMGCASSLGLGLALSGAAPRVVILDGDGAALMRLEAMASVGWHRPPGYVHVILDNACYESTGGQYSISPGVDFERLAVACGYADAVQVSTPDTAARFLARALEQPGPHLIHVKILPGSDPGLGRPAIAPQEVAERFRRALADARP